MFHILIRAVHVPVSYVTYIRENTIVITEKNVYLVI